MVITYTSYIVNNHYHPILILQHHPILISIILYQHHPILSYTNNQHHPILFLQKPFSKSKASDHIQCIKRRLKLWLSGDLTALLEEGHSTQRGLTCPRVSNDSCNVSLSFSKLMLQGRVRAALR